MLPAEVADEWWTPGEAERRTGFSSETIRNWARTNVIERRQAAHGGRSDTFEVRAADVLRETGNRKPRERGKRPSTAAPGSDGHQIAATYSSPPIPADLERLAMLEEVVLRHRMIDGLRAEIEERRLKIDQHMQDIEGFLLGPSSVPNG